MNQARLFTDEKRDAPQRGFSMMEQTTTERKLQTQSIQVSPYNPVDSSPLPSFENHPLRNQTVAAKFPSQSTIDSKASAATFSPVRRHRQETQGSDLSIPTLLAQ